MNCVFSFASLHEMLAIVYSNVKRSCSIMMCIIVFKQKASVYQLYVMFLLLYYYKIYLHKMSRRPIIIDDPIL